ncbi:hypothetical protein VitviT2T_015790 [Vitis vinifera]|uniref:Uncharacterized protein n=1 Tax=Vitis vinifera TaxID=29760 RepID=A0ABY9CR57_VITVI|nr:hypothetical protein VitviT2T_015790 [Vitis vinifera]
MYLLIVFFTLLGVPFPFASNSSTIAPRCVIKRLMIKLSILFFLFCVFYLLCLILGSIDIFWALLSKAGVSMGCRALCSFVFKIGCSGALALAIGFAVKALLATEAAPYLANMVLPAGAEASVNQAPGRNDAGPSNAGPYNVVPADSPLRSFPSVPSSLTPIPFDPSVPSVPSLPSLEENNLFGREQSAPPQPPALPGDTNEPHNLPYGVRVLVRSSDPNRLPQGRHGYFLRKNTVIQEVSTGARAVSGTALYK